MKIKQTLFLIIFAIAGIFLFRALTKPAQTSEQNTSNTPALPPAKKQPIVISDQSPTHTKSQKIQNSPAGALPNERIVSFSSQEALEDYLRSIKGSGLYVIGQSHYSPTLRIGFKDQRAFLNSLPAGAQTQFNFPVETPPIAEGEINPNASPFQGRLKEWMGVFGDNSEWGSGVSVAVIDSGLLPHSAFGSDVNVFSVAGDPNNPDLNSHGTAMASLWRSADGVIPALAPAVDLTSIQVADDNGDANLFNLAEAIFLAVEEGAQLIPISMGAANSNDLLDTAITHAMMRAF